ncbi:MAG TPA: GNAT family N-acetyltransferase [Oxalicibacterium sp.]|uniref:GNAT family N-acetyltransferase n=1 Tax=Oxalicibacterium sp. TaxID=2766525 RepID=UPI002C841900|nr:GNAT family N-acetyltransferase [Oxalicibacterium sp.]HWU99111.1 GNAT family N-acetyltransferase [Oxalicibacterium sp.]
MQTQIREATLDDAQLIANLTRAAWADRVAVTSGGHRETAISVSEHLLQGGGFILFVDGAPAGSARWLPREDNPDIWEMLRIGVLPAYRGLDLSQQLVEAVIHHAYVNDIEELRLAVRHDQPRLLDLYAAYDFEEAPELEYAHANPMDPPPTVMRRKLKN